MKATGLSWVFDEISGYYTVTAVRAEYWLGDISSGYILHYSRSGCGENQRFITRDSAQKIIQFIHDFEAYKL